MLTCPSCHSQQYNGTIFCPICGVSFLAEDRRRDTTSALGSRPVSRPVMPPPAPAAPVPLSERELRGTVLNNGRRIKLPLQVPILIGRADSARAFYPDLDLSNDGGYEAGVSRRHARIALTNAEAYVEDLESSNGTFVNNRQLSPRTPQVLKPGDEVRFGSLIVRIEVI